MAKEEKRVTRERLTRVRLTNSTMLQLQQQFANELRGSSHFVPPSMAVTTGEDAVVNLTDHFALALGKGWREMLITDACAPGLGNRIRFETEGDITFRISSITREDVAEGTPCSF